MASPYEGGMNIKLNGVNYPLVINLRVLSQFCAETGEDFHHVAVSALNKFQRCDMEDKQGLERAAQLTSVVSLTSAAWLFYLAAKEANNQVEFGEIQEALLWEGCVIREETNGYAVKFVEVATFAIIGIMDEPTKKPLPE